MEQHYRELDNIVKEHKISARIRFKIQDLIELRQVRRKKLIDFFSSYLLLIRLHGLPVVLKQNQQQLMKFMNKNMIDYYDVIKIMVLLLVMHIVEVIKRNIMIGVVVVAVELNNNQIEMTMIE